MPQASRTKFNYLDISFNTGYKAEMIDIYKKSAGGLHFMHLRLCMNGNACKDFFTVLTFNFPWFDYNFV